MTAARLDHFELLFPSEYIKHVELKGKDVTLTIRKVELSDLQMRGGRKKRKGVIWFEETEKKLVLGRECAEAVVGMYGKYTGDWVGKRITIYPDPTVKFGTETVGGTRIRKKAPAPARGSKSDPAPVDPADFESDTPSPDDPGAA